MNATVGDIAANAERIRAGRDAALQAGADLVLFPELALTGYPPEDLLLREHFLADAAAALRELAAETHETVAVVGFPERDDGVYNSAAVLADGAVQAVYRKVHLPNYGVFDEERYFQAGDGGRGRGHRRPTGIVQRVGLTVCEDIWEPGPPASDEALAGATLILNISASPYHAGKGMERERMFAQRARDDVAYVAFCALVGGQDELVFDGHSFVVDHTGQTIARAAQFREDLLICDVDLEEAAAARVGDAGDRGTARSPVSAAGASRVQVLSGVRVPAGHGDDEASQVRWAARRAAGAGRGRDLRGAGARAARLRGEERLLARRARAVRRDRFRARRVHRGRRARRRARERGDHALALLLLGHSAGRARSRRGARRACARAADRAARRDLRRDARAGVRRDCPTTSPRRTCRRACAGTC